MMNLQYALLSDSSWQQLTNWQTPDTPFMSFEFWQALSDTGAIGEKAGWLPIYILIHRPNDIDGDATEEALTSSKLSASKLSSEQIGQPIAVMPVFIKGHHQGEFVFDHAWAQAYAQYGLDYYPRLVTSAPYTPITGQRLWLAEGEVLDADILKAAIAGVDDIAQQVEASGWHGLFVTPEVAAIAHAALPTDIDIEMALNSQANEIVAKPIELPILERQGCQFLWQNKHLSEGSQTFTDFEAFWPR